jgi:hypothetical protein
MNEQMRQTCYAQQTLPNLFCSHYKYVCICDIKPQSAKEFNTIFKLLKNDCGDSNYQLATKKIARLLFCTCPCYCINFFIYAKLRTRATWSTKK